MEKIDKYRILKRLGEGGFGAVYLCHDHDMERDVAIKVFRPRDVNLVAFATSSSEDGLQVLRERFKREARILARLHDNPYIVSALEFGETENGSPWYAMDYVPDNLQQRLGKDVFDRAGLDELDQSAHPRALPLEQCLTLLHQVLQGMKAAHAHGLVHRDIKPSNILLSDAGEVRIADFGIAKEPDTQISVSRVAMGSRNYMAPEQRESAKHVDRRADIYSIGVLAYRMLTGKLPTGRYADPEVVAPQLGKTLNGMILKALEEDKDKRFRDAGEMLEAYEKARQQRDQEDEADSGATYTDVSSDEPVSEVSEKYRPLYNIIKETLLEHGAITPRQREIEATAAMLEVDGEGLKSIVANVTAAHKEIPALQKLLNLIERELEKLPAQTAGKETQAQTERLIGDLLPAAKLAGKDRAWLEARMQVTLGEQERSSPRTAPHTASKQAADSSYTEPAKRSFLLQASAVFAVVAVSVVVGLWFWSAEYRLYPVTITSNVTNARITLRGNGNDYTYRNGLQLPPGSYQVDISAPEHVSQTRTVSLDSDQIIDFVLEQVLYPVTITSNVTNARITLRGNGNDYTYRNGLQLPPGSYQVDISAPEHVSQTRTVSLDSDQIIDFVLEQVLYPVTITSNVTNARITLRGNGNDYTYRNGLQLPPGSYQVDISAPEHVSQTRTVSLDSDQIIDFVLEQVLYPVTITSNVTNARITLRGNGNDYTYRNGLRLPAGSYQVSAMAERYVTLSETWQVSGNDSPLYLELEIDADFGAGQVAYNRGNYATALQEFRPLADQGHAEAQNSLGFMYQNGKGVAQDDRQAVEWYRKAADQGNAAGQNNLGYMYANGRGVAQDDRQAVEWYRKAADQGNAAGQNSLGFMYRNGRGVAQDDRQAVEWFRKAADQGNATAQRNLGVMYQNGIGVSQDDRQAVEWFRKAADQGHASGQNRLGVMYQDGRGVAQDDRQAVEWYRKAADQGHALGQNNLGFMYDEGRGVAQDDRQAVEWYRKAADQGNATAQRNLGSMYRNGRGVAQDDRQAVEWYRKAADQGNASAQNSLGFMYDEGRGVAQDYRQAVEWYRKAADQGNASAQNNLGFMYDEGRGVAQDYRQAEEWYRKAADQGNALAQNNLGVMYQDGRGVAQDDRQAVEWYRKAADQGDATAQNNLGFMYQNGRGVAQDYRQAVEWYRKAADQGHVEARERLSAL